MFGYRRRHRINRWFLCGTVFLFAASLLSAISVATENWSEVPDPIISSRWGLWKLCHGSLCHEFHTGLKCSEPPPTGDCDSRSDCAACRTLNTARAFAVLTVLANGLAALFFSGLATAPDPSRLTLRFAAGTTLFAGLAAVAAVITFTEWSKEFAASSGGGGPSVGGSPEAGWSSLLMVIGCGLSLCASVTGYFA